jgi:stage II sporulation protein M
MNKRLPTPARLDAGSDSLGLLLCAALFLCGCAAGTVAAGLSPPGDALAQYISGILPSADGARPLFPAVLFGVCKYHLAALFFGFSLLGVLCIPGIVAMRGFFLCFSVSYVVRGFGPGGIPLALSMFALDAVFTVPCFFVLAVQSFSSSARLFKGVLSRGGYDAVYGGGFFRRCAVCAGVLCASALSNTFFAPFIVRYFAENVNF